VHNVRSEPSYCTTCAEDSQRQRTEELQDADRTPKDEAFNEGKHLGDLGFNTFPPQSRHQRPISRKHNLDRVTIPH